LEPALTDRISRTAVALVIVATVATVAAGPARAAFDLEGPTPRAIAVGDAASALITDASALYYNPAALVELATPQVAFSHNRIGNFDFLSHNLAYGGISTGRFGGLAAGVRVFSTESGAGDNLSTELTVSVGQGITVLEDVHSSLAIGWTAHFHQLDFGTSAGTYVPATESYVGGIDLGSGATIGVDVGVRALLESRTALSAVLRNVNRPSLGDTDSVQLLEELVLGATYEPYPDVITTGEVEVASGEEPARLRAGVEYRIADPLTLRVGVGSEPARFSGGARIGFGHFVLDYAFGDHPILPASHFIGVGVEF